MPGAPAASSPKASPSTKSRNKAGDACCAALAGRNTHNNCCCWAAASCRRRKAPGCACGNQAITASTSRQRNACSAAHNAALALSGRSRHRRPGDSPCAWSAGAKGSQGGATTTTGPARRASACANAGNTNCHSCRPASGCNTSLIPPTGQPPPGSCASSSAYPVDCTCWGPAPSVSACQTPGTAEGRSDATRRRKRGAGIVMGWLQKQEHCKYNQYFESGQISKPPYQNDTWSGRSGERGKKASPAGQSSHWR